MWEGSYGKEPFDLRLTVLRFLRNLNKILLLTLAATLIFGGGYYVGKVVFRPAVEYSATSTYKVNYTVPPVNSNDYYINETTWNTLVHSEEFLQAAQLHLLASSEAIVVPEEKALGKITTAGLSDMLSAKLPSDWNIPTVTVTTTDERLSLQIAAAVDLAMSQELADMLGEVASIQVISPATETTEVELDVRPVRAFVLSAVLSFFLAAVLFLLKELGDDSIWLPVTIRRRYGLPVVGTINSREAVENLSYLFRGKGKIGICSVNQDVDVTKVTRALTEKIGAVESVETDCHKKQWIPMPTPLLCPEGCRELRKMDGILLVVAAGSRAGKPLEQVKEFLEQQDCKITAVMLWNADERLIDAYYFLRKKEV